MHQHLAASLVVLGMAVSSSFAGPTADSLAEDEQLLRAAGLRTEGAALLDFFHHLTLTDADREQIQRLIKQLGDDEFDVREKASEQLVKLGPKTISLLRPALKDGDRELSRRAEDCLRRLEDGGKITAPASPHLPAAAARWVAIRKPAGAAEVLLRYLPFAEQETILEEVELALAAVAVREGKVEPGLVKALSATDSLSRGVAGAALARAGVAEQKNAVRKLLLDSDLKVRLRVSMALVSAKEKDAVPVLIELLGQLPAEQVWPVEEVLVRLAGDRSPAVSLGTDEASQKMCRDAWAGWWRDHGAALEMPTLDGPRPLLGYTLVAAPNSAKVIELDRDGKVRWEVGGLRSPFEAHVLPGDRVLIAEYSGFVTERNLKGDILWEKQIPSAMQCQRFPNGNTFIVTITQLVEIEPAGKERVLYESKAPNYLLVARKLRNGQIVVMHGNGTVIRLDAAGKEMNRFAVGRVSNNCLDVLPNGHLVVARYFDGKVVEYDTQGKMVWEIACPSAFSAQRLPNGNTLVACHDQPRVVELDRTGKEVWVHTVAGAWFARRR